MSIGYRYITLRPLHVTVTVTVTISPPHPPSAHPSSALRDEAVVVLPQRLPEEVDVRLGPYASLQLLHLLVYGVRT